MPSQECATREAERLSDSQPQRERHAPERGGLEGDRDVEAAIHSIPTKPSGATPTTTNPA